MLGSQHLRLKQEDCHKFEVSLDYTVRICLKTKENPGADQSKHWTAVLGRVPGLGAGGKVV